MSGVNDLAELTEKLLDDINSRTAKSKKAMVDAKAQEVQRNTDAIAVQQGMTATAGNMDRTPIQGSPGVSMASRYDSHPVGRKKVPIKNNPA